MKTDPYRVRDGSSSLHTLVPITPNAKKNRGRVLSLTGLALVAGVVGAMVWLMYPGLGSLDVLPRTATVQSAAATATQVAPVASLPTATITSMTAVTRLPSPPAVANQPLVAVPFTPTSTPTATPEPYISSTEGVVGVGGAGLWSEAGMLVQSLTQGALLTVTERSTDGDWLHAQTGTRQEGWVAAASMLVFNVDRLRPQAVVIIPITPTPTSSVPLAATAVAMLPGGENAAGSATPAMRPTPAAGAGPTARVAMSGSRLNVRAGPGSSYGVITKALPGEVFVVSGRDQTSGWLKINVPDVTGGFGWVSAEFMQTSVEIGSLPVAKDVSTAPPYAGDGGSGGADGATGYHAPSQPMIYAAAQAAPTPTSSARPASGLSGQLAIQTKWGGDIYLYDLASGGLRLLTGGFDPAISPDGKQVAFTRNGGENGVYLINSDGSNEHSIFTGRELLRSPKWSPDGKWIVFERGDQFIYCKDQSSRCRLTPPLPSGDIPEKEREPQLAVVDVNGSNYHDLAVLLHARVPDWNAAGVVYQSAAGIQITEDKPNVVTRLVYFDPHKQYEQDPDWQPGGGKIVFQRRELDHWEIYSVNPDGSGLRALTYPVYTLVDKLPSNVAPAWSPDGKHIVFLSNRMPNHSAGDFAIWVMDADGSNPHRLPVNLSFTYTYVDEQMLDWAK